MGPEPRVPVLVFAKAPDPGMVKTRLSAAIGAGAAAVLAARLALRAVATACESRVGEVELWCAPDVAHPFFELCRRRHGVSLHPQVGDPLGARMAHALRAALLRAPAAILIGADVPTMSATHLRAAASALVGGHDAVIGPAEDGGYWLLGLRHVDDTIFADVPWGTGDVLACTRQRLDALGWRVAETATRWDVDRPEDFERLCSDAETASLAAALRDAA
jgi:uncharacterized protein